MRQLTLLTADPKQTLKVLLDNGTRVTLTLQYSERQQGWFYDLSYGDYSYKGRRLVLSPNMLRAFKDFLLFGLACFTTDGYEPAFRNDFSSGRVKVYLLSQDEIATVEQGIAAYG